MFKPRYAFLKMVLNLKKENTTFLESVSTAEMVGSMPKNLPKPLLKKINQHLKIDFTLSVKYLSKETILVIVMSQPNSRSFLFSQNKL